MSPEHAITAMRQRADTIAIETSRIAGALRAINDMGGFAAAEAAARLALQRVCRAAPNTEGWVA